MADIEDVVAAKAPKDERIVVYFADSKTTAELFELQADGKGHATRKHIASYSNHEYTTVAGLEAILRDVKTAAPAKSYAMIMGCHGLGWIPASWQSYTGLPGTAAGAGSEEWPRPHWETPGVPMTRYYGGTDASSRADITTLSGALEAADIKLDYLLLDLCYMANVEVAYELRERVDVLIASPTEIMAYGMPYATVLPRLLGTPDYAGAVEEFYKFYSNASDPYGALSAIKCSATEEIAAQMKLLNSAYTFDSGATTRVQKLDGYRPTIFFDLASYAGVLASGNTTELEQAIANAVIAERHTPQAYTMAGGVLSLQTNCGLTVSDPSTNAMAARKRETAWYAATH